MKSAMYPGTFDPVHNGHLDVIRRAGRVFDRVVVSVAASEGKGIRFPLADRLAMVEEAIEGMSGVEAVPFEGLLVHQFERLGVDTVVRGVRLFQDFEFEYTMALMNRRLSRAFDVFFLMPSEEVLSVSSTLIKDIHDHGGDVSELVPEGVLRRLGSAGG